MKQSTEKKVKFNATETKNPESTSSNDQNPLVNGKPRIPVHIQRENARIWAEKEFGPRPPKYKKPKKFNKPFGPPTPVHIQRENAIKWAEVEFAKK